jgi:predicted RNA binding protein YcfA (HicA-like mRNA interferase family)
MPRHPRVSGKDTVQALKRAGFVVFDQGGSHVYLHGCDAGICGPRVIVPVHGTRILAPLTLKHILDASGLSLPRFTSLL